MAIIGQLNSQNMMIGRQRGFSKVVYLYVINITFIFSSYYFFNFMIITITTKHFIFYLNLFYLFYAAIYINYFFWWKTYRIPNLCHRIGIFHLPHIDWVLEIVKKFFGIHFVN